MGPSFSRLGWLSAPAAIVLPGSVVTAQSTPASSAKDEILKLLQSEMLESLVVNKIHALAGHWTPLPMQIALKNAGTKPPEMEAMTKRGFSISRDCFCTARAASDGCGRLFRRTNSGDP